MDINYSNLLSFLSPALLDKILIESFIKDIPRGTEVLREEQYVKVLPIVIEGLVKVYSRFEEKDLLLYYIEPAQSCVMTFYAALKNTPSKVFAITEEDSKLILIPADYLSVLVKEFPDFNEMFYGQFNLRYTELLDTIGYLLVHKMDKRVYEHIRKKIDLGSFDAIKMSHQQIANELGTAREVVSRILKKLEFEGKILQDDNGIKIINTW